MSQLHDALPHAATRSVDADAWFSCFVLLRVVGPFVGQCEQAGERQLWKPNLNSGSDCFAFRLRGNVAVVIGCFLGIT